MCPSDDPADTLKLDSLQRDVLLPQIEAFLGAAREPEAQAIYLSLKESIQKMEVPANLQARLGAIVEVTLASGRARKQFGPGAELSLAALFQKTPQGKEVAESIRALNAALAKLTDQSIENASATLRGPGAYALTLKTSGCQIVIRFDGSGVRVESMEFDLG